MIRSSLLKRLRWFARWCVMLVALPLAAQVPDTILLIKNNRFSQVSATDVNPAGAEIGVAVSFATTPAAGLGVQLRTPTGTSFPLVRQADGTFELTRVVETGEALESTFSEGGYALIVSGGASSSTLTFAVNTGATYAPTRISNFDTLQALPSGLASVQWQPIRNAVSGDFLSLEITRTDGATVYSSAESLSGSATSQFVSNLPLFSALTGQLGFAHVNVVALNAGATRLAAGRGFTLEFPLLAKPAAPVITYQPLSKVTAPGQIVIFTAVATGLEPLTFQWKKDGVAIPGATGFELRFDNVQASAAGLYTFEATSPAGRTMSEPASLAVGPTVSYSLFAGTPGRPGSADGPLETARFSSVSGIAVDGRGEVYVVDSGNNAIRKISTAGVVTTFAGLPGPGGYADGPPGAARFNGPHSIAVDAAGNFFVTDAGNFVVRKISSSGVVTTLAGSPGNAGAVDGMERAARFRFPSGLVLDQTGSLFVVDQFDHTIRKITPAGEVTTFAGRSGQAGFVDGSGTAARFSSPQQIAIDATGTMFVTDRQNGAIRKLSDGGSVTTISVSSGSADYRGIAADGVGGLFVAFGGGVQGAVLRLRYDGESLGGTWARYEEIAPGASGFSYFNPFALAADGRGGAYVSDLYNGAILRVVGVPGRGDPGIRISTQPAASQTVASGASVALGVEATGPDIYYQWLRNGVPIRGATLANLFLPTTTASDQAVYTVRIANVAGSVVSSPTALTLAPVQETARLLNLSIRSQAGVGAQTLIVGVAVGGGAMGATKPVLLRGVGPGLAAFGVSGTLTDPVLELYRGGQVLAANDNWGGGATLSNAFASVGAFALALNSADAAMTNAVGPGAYSVQVSGQGGTMGIVLAEVYDAAVAAGVTAPRLVNLSARAPVGTGADILIAGFVVGGTVNKTLLIRAVGPGLAAFGVTGTLADPVLRLHGDGGLIASNDNWSREVSLTTLFSRVGAFSLGSDKDSVLLVTLPPGRYSVQVGGVGTATGVALVEIYEVP